MVKSTTAITSPSWTKVLQKNLSSDQLLKRLKDAQHKLSEADPDEIDKVILERVRDELIKEELLFHKGKEIRASLACCLADLLRLFAPNPPCDEEQLQTIFQFFLSVLTLTNGGLSKPMGPLFSDASNLLENLVNTKSLLLIWELESHEEFVCDYFTNLFSVMKTETPRKVEILVSNALILLLSEGDEAPRKVTELLIAHLHPSVKRTNPVASHLAALVCNGASSHIQGNIGQYFTNEMVKATSKEETLAMEQALQKIHTLIIHINKSAPAVLVSIMPQLDDGLRAENDTLREASVKTLGLIFSEKAADEGRGGDLAQKYPATWKAWLGRSQDKNIAIRLLWTEATRGLIIHHPELQLELEECMIRKLLDTDERVRISMIKVFGTLDFEALCHHVPKRILVEIGERTFDKKEAVRNEALDVIGRAYSLAYPEIMSGNEIVVEQFARIPNTIISGLEPSLEGSLVAIQQTFSKYILPLPRVNREEEEEEEVAWINRLILVLQSLEDDNVGSLAKISNLLDRRDDFADFINACQQFNGGVIEGSQQDIGTKKSALIRPIEHIVNLFSDPANAARELNAFAKQNDSRSYKLMKIIMDGKSDVKTYGKAVMEMKKKANSNTGKKNTTMSAFVTLAGFPFIGTSSTPALISKLQEMGDDEKDKKLKDRIFHLMKLAAKRDPSMFLNHIPLLFQTIRSSDTKGKATAVCLMVLAKVESSKVGKGQVSLDKAILKILRKLMIGGSYQEARYAAKVLALVSSRGEEGNTAKRVVEEVCEEIAHDLAEYDSSRLVASMAALKQFIKHASETLRHVSTSMAQKVVQSVLLKPWSEENKRKGEEKDEGVDEWVEDEEMNDELRARVIGVQFLTQQCLAYAEQDGVNSMILPTLKLLFTCLTQGQPLSTLESNAVTRARFRNVAALSLLKLAREKSCENNISVQDFQTFATAVQDVTFQVRQQFLNKLIQYAIKRSSNLPPRYFVLVFMTAFDPEEGNRNLVRTTCARLHSLMTQELRLKYFDVGLARLLHLLNHYPDFADGGLNDVENLKNVAVYLDFYLDCCANQSNMACLYYIANRCKGHQDVMGEEASEGLYKLSELAMCLIKRRADALGCNVGNWAGRVTLPDDLYRPMPSRVNQNEVYKTSYLSDEVLDYFQQMAVKRPSTGLTKRKAPFRAEDDVVGGAQPSKKKNKVRSTKVANTGKKVASQRKQTSKKKKKKADHDEDDESELSEETIEEDDEVIMSEAESQIDDDDDYADGKGKSIISEDEEVESSEEEGAAQGRGQRIKEKLKKEKIARNEERKRRRQALTSNSTASV